MAVSLAPRRRRPTVRGVAARFLVRFLLVGGALAGPQLVADVLRDVERGSDVAILPATVPPAAGGPAALAAEHGCWDHGDAPANVIPGHVVAAEVGYPARLGGRRLTDLALRQIFEGEDHGLVVHAFCP